MSRPPLDRINKAYYKKNVILETQQPKLLEEDSEINDKEKRLADLIQQLSKAQAERFWYHVDRWYTDYRARDKVRALLEVLQDVDMNAMLQRDLAILKDELKKELEKEKEKIRLRVEREKKEEFEKKVMKLRESYECQLKNRMKAKEREIESKKDFVVRCMWKDSQERFAPVMEKYKKRCIQWIETLRDKQNASSMKVIQRKARELALIADKCDIGERTRQRLVAALGKEHEEMEKILGKAVEARYVVIEGLKKEIVNLTRDVNVWRRAVGEVLASFKKFVHHVLETRPERAQYFSSLEKLYQLQMDDLIKDASDELEKIETREEITAGSSGEPLQPTMEIKCPSQDIRSPSEPSVTGSTSDTDIEKDLRAEKVADHAVDFAIKAALPSLEHSVSGEGEEEENLLKEIEELMVLYSSQVHHEEVPCEENLEEKKLQDTRTQMVGDGDSDPCISVEEFTRRRIREMLEIMSSKNRLIKSHIHL